MTDKTTGTVFPEFGIGGGPAFPLVFEYMDEHGTMQHIQFGMFLRDYFAAKAMAAMIPEGDMDGLAICEAAYAYADEMLAERERE